MNNGHRRVTSPHRSVTEAPDGDLVARAGRGDRTAFGMLYLRHHQAAWRMAGVASGFSDDAEVALIDGFTAVFSALPADPGPDDFRHHLLVCVRRIALDRIFPRALAASAGDTANPDHVSGHHPADDEVADANIVRGGLLALPEIHRTALWLTEVEAWTPTEVATALALDLGTVPVMLNGARDALAHHCGLVSRRRARPTRAYRPALGAALASTLSTPPPLGGECQRRWLRERAMHAGLVGAARSA